MEEQVLFRAPPSLAERLHKAFLGMGKIPSVELEKVKSPSNETRRLAKQVTESKSLFPDTHTSKESNEKRSVSEKEFSHYLVRVGQDTYDAILVEMATVVETHRTNDHKQFYKSGNLSRMLYVLKDRANTTDPALELPIVDSSLRQRVLAHGLTPPTQHIVERRFRKAHKKIVGNCTPEEINHAEDMIFEIAARERELARLDLMEPPDFMQHWPDRMQRFTIEYRNGVPVRADDYNPTYVDPAIERAAVNFGRSNTVPSTATPSEQIMPVSSLPSVEYSSMSTEQNLNIPVDLDGDIGMGMFAGELESDNFEGDLAGEYGLSAQEHDVNSDSPTMDQQQNEPLSTPINVSNSEPTVSTTVSTGTAAANTIHHSEKEAPTTMSESSQISVVSSCTAPAAQSITTVMSQPQGDDSRIKELRGKMENLQKQVLDAKSHVVNANNVMLRKRFTATLQAKQAVLRKVQAELEGLLK